MSQESDQQCPCGSQSSYAECCAPYHQQSATPQTALALMRSRYSAYAQRCIQYLVDTTHPESRTPDLTKQIENWSAQTQWLELEILQHQQGNPSDKWGKVEFIAHYLENGLPQKHHEYSRFKKWKNRWYYVDGKTN